MRVLHVLMQLWLFGQRTNLSRGPGVRFSYCSAEQVCAWSNQLVRSHVVLPGAASECPTPWKPPLDAWLALGGKLSPTSAPNGRVAVSFAPRWVRELCTEGHCVCDDLLLSCAHQQGSHALTCRWVGLHLVRWLRGVDVCSVTVRLTSRLLLL